MVIDTSALVAILRDEPDAARYAHAIADAEVCRVSVASYVELGAVIDVSHDPAATRRPDELLQYAGIRIEPVDVRQGIVARAAYRDFGKGSGHAAALDFGDCFSYALAKVLGEPLLFKGHDFIHTDVASALPS